MTYQMPNKRPGFKEKKLSNRHLESRMQQALVKWFRYQHKVYKRLLFAIPNGGERSTVEAAIMQGEGVEPGVPDLHLAVARGGYFGLYMELKVLPNDLDPDQIDMMDRLTKQGYLCQPVYTLDQGLLCVNDYLSLPPTTTT